MTDFRIRDLDEADRGFALVSWRESHKDAPGVCRVPWSFYKHEYGKIFSQILNDPKTRLLGAYTEDDKLLGWLAMTPGRSVNTLHWIHVKFEHAGAKLRRRGLMYALIEEAELGPRFIYTLRARKKLDETLVAALLCDKSMVGTYVALKEWIK